LLPWKLRNISPLNCGRALAAVNNGMARIEMQQCLLFSTVEIKTFPNVCTSSADTILLKESACMMIICHQQHESALRSSCRAPDVFVPFQPNLESLSRFL